jgi:hypothetical protein
MEFKKVKKAHILQGIQDYQEKGLPKEFGPSSTYDIVYEGERYPPKAIMAYANFHAVGKEITAYFKGGRGTDCFHALKREGFEINYKKDPLIELISNYKTYIATTKMQDEVYKWELVNKYKGHPDINAEDFTAEIKSIKFGNLIYAMSIAVVNHLAKSKPEELRELFKALLNESNPLKERISNFNIDSLTLYRSLGKTLGHHQDERSMATYLTFHNPEKYTFYKSTFYKKFCELLFVKPLGKNEKYVHYLELLQEFIDKYIATDQELIDAVKGYIPEYYDGKNHLLLAQDMLYCMLNKPRESSLDIVELIQDFIVQADKGDLKTSSYPKEYDKLKLKVSFGQGVAARIPWIGLYKAPNTISKGIYPVFLYYKEYNKLVLAYGISETEKSDFSWKNTDQLQSIEAWHLQEFQKKPDRYGSSFIKGIYDIKEGLDEDKLESDLEELIAEYEEIDFTRLSNYWIFQGNPKVYDFVGAMKKGVVDTWTVSGHKDKMKVEDKAIMWITGEDAGCYALGKITREPFRSGPEKDEFWKAEVKSEWKAGLEMTHNLVEDPITKKMQEEDELLRNLKVGNQGSSFSATKEEYDKLISMIEEKSDFLKFIKNFKEKDLVCYFQFMDEIIQRNNLSLGDKRLTFTYNNKRLNLTIGQRYSWNLFASDARGKFGVLSKEPLNEESKQYDGSKPKPWYTHLKTFEPSIVELDNIHESLTHELNRTDVSGFRRHNKEDFEKYTFDKSNIAMIQPINRILYGPPGTGKTYYLRNELFPRYTAMQSPVTRADFLARILKDLKWWEVIALVLMDISVGKVSDIDQHEFLKVKEIFSNNIHDSIVWRSLQTHTVLNCESVENVNRNQPQIFFKNEDSTWRLDKEGFESVEEELTELMEKLQDFESEKNLEIKRYEFVTFHQSYAYEDFIEGIKPVMEDESDGNIQYEIKDGVFKKLCQRAGNDPNNNYAIFIDEINRGNVSSIFGELITLIENDKRIGAENTMTATLPYSRSQFGVPSNVHIYGTMNTADRSVEALDTALRRRFSFKEMLPNPSKLKGTIEGIKLSLLLTTLNDRIEVLVDRDHTIGHAFFINDKNLDDLRHTFANKIIPLLQEYFYGDYGKMEMVIGSPFFKVKDTSKVKFAVKPEDFDPEGKVYHIIDVTNKKSLSDEVFIDALNELIKGEA